MPPCTAASRTREVSAPSAVHDKLFLQCARRPDLANRQSCHHQQGLTSPGTHPALGLRLAGSPPGRASIIKLPDVMPSKQAERYGTRAKMSTSDKIIPADFVGAKESNLAPSYTEDSADVRRRPPRE